MANSLKTAYDLRITGQQWIRINEIFKQLKTLYSFKSLLDVSRMVTDKDVRKILEIVSPIRQLHFRASKKSQEQMASLRTIAKK